MKTFSTKRDIEGVMTEKDRAKQGAENSKNVKSAENADCGEVGKIVQSVEKVEAAEVDNSIKSAEKVEAADNAEKPSEVERLSAEYEAKIAELKSSFAAETALIKAGVRNVKAAMALMDMSGIKADDEGIAELEKQVKALKKDKETAFLFKDDTFYGGFEPEEGFDTADEDIISYEKFCELYRK